MLKTRYFRVRIPSDVSMEKLAKAARKRGRPALDLLQAGPNEIALVLTSQRVLRTVQYLADGSTSLGTATTMERCSVRIFRSGDELFLSVQDPPRGTKHVAETLDILVENGDYFFEAFELTTTVIERHLSIFQSSKLVSAKVRDLQIFERAVARLEVSSKEGLSEGIAPILEGKFYRIDSLTYEVVQDFKRGLVCYGANGTIRMSSPISESGFVGFERQLSVARNAVG